MSIKSDGRGMRETDTKRAHKLAKTTIDALVGRDEKREASKIKTAKVVITFEDSDDGNVDLRVDFEPPIADELTAAQMAAVMALNAITHCQKREDSK